MTKIIDLTNQTPREATDEVLLAVGMCPKCKKEVEWYHWTGHIGGIGDAHFKTCQECYYETRCD